MGLIGIIPARGGSKGIKNKNIKHLLGKPLIVYSIEAAIQSKCFDTLVVTSDDDAILDVASKYNVGLLKRPESISSDTATSDSVIAHALQSLNPKGPFEDLMLLQPTSPLRTASDISESWSLYKNIQPNILISVSKVELELQKAFVEGKDGYLSGLLSKDAPFQRRQDLPNVFLPNGAIYICSCKAFSEEEGLPRDRIFPFVMASEKSVDIDTMEDWLQAEQILIKRGYNAQ